MKTYGTLHPTENAPQAPDTRQTLLLAAGTPQNLDWPSTLAQLVRITAMSTLGLPMGACVSLNSTGAIAPTSGLSTGSTAGALPNLTVMGEGTFQIPAGSTGWSAAASAPGYVSAEVWRM